MDGRDETVSLARNRFDVLRFVGGVAERVAKRAESGVEIGVEIDVGIGGPKARANFIAANDAAGAFEKNRENLKRLLVELDFETIAAQVALREIDFKCAEAHA